jgi:hypothetical protein
MVAGYKDMALPTLTRYWLESKGATRKLIFVFRVAESCPVLDAL